MQVTARNGTRHVCFLDTNLVTADSNLPQRETFEIFVILEETWCLSTEDSKTGPHLSISLFVCSLIHSVTHFSSPCSVPGTVLSTEEVTVNKTKVPALVEPSCRWGDTCGQQVGQ